MGDAWDRPPGEVFDIDDPVTGWRCQHVTMSSRHPFLSGERRGEWAKAKCRYHRHPAPCPTCHCGFRLCVDMPTIVEYDHAGGSTVRQFLRLSPAYGCDQPCVIMRCEAKGKACYNAAGWEEQRGIALGNTLSVEHVRPIFPAYTISARVTEFLKRTYDRDDVYTTTRESLRSFLWT